MRVVWLTLGLLVATFAGCAEPTTTEASEPEPTVPENELNTTMPQGPQSFAANLYFGPGGALTHEIPADGSTLVHSDLVSGFAGAEWNVHQFTGPFLAEPLRILPGTYKAEVWLEAEQPYLDLGLSDYVLWGLATSGLSLSSPVMQTGPVLPGEPFKVEFELDVGHTASVFIGRENAVMLEFGTFNTAADTNALRMLWGPEYPSHVNLTFTTVPENPLATSMWREIETFSGNVAYGQFLMPTGGAFVEHAVEIPEDANGLRLVLTGRGDGLRADVDLVLYGADGIGAPIMRTSGSGSSEQLHVIGEDIEPYRGQTLTLRVQAFIGYNVNYDVIYSAATPIEA